MPLTTFETSRQEQGIIIMCVDVLHVTVIVRGRDGGYTIILRIIGNKKNAGIIRKTLGMTFDNSYKLSYSMHNILL